MLPLEKTILRQLLAWPDYAAKVVPYLKVEYFHSAEAQNIYILFEKFYQRFKVSPSFAALRIGLDTVKTLTEQQAKDAAEQLKEVEAEPVLASDQTEWLIGVTEEYVQERAVYVALQESIKLMDDPKKDKHAIPDVMQKALSISFDTHVGHDWAADAEQRWEFYHKPESRIPFDLDSLNMITKGGVPKKTLNIVLAGTNVGKSLFLVHFAASCVRMGKNVLYITLEMAEEWISQRIDANMMDIPMDDVTEMPKDMYMKKINALKLTSLGKFKVKEYPTATGHVGHFRALVQELYLKQNFKPDVVIVDYLTICASSRVKLGNAVNSYFYNKFIAEELRGLATELNVPVWSAAQFNREGFEASNGSLANIGESFAIPMTADFLFALIQTEELEKANQIALQPLKNRYAKRNSFSQTLMGIDTSRMKLYDLTPAQQAAATMPTPQSSPTNNAKAGQFGPRLRRPLKQLKKEHPDAENE